MTSLSEQALPWMSLHWFHAQASNVTKYHKEHCIVKKAVTDTKSDPHHWKRSDRGLRNGCPADMLKDYKCCISTVNAARPSLKMTRALIPLWHFWLQLDVFYVHIQSFLFVLVYYLFIYLWIVCLPVVCLSEIGLSIINVNFRKTSWRVLSCLE